MAFFSCKSSNRCSSNSQEFYHLSNPNLLDDDDDDMLLLLHQQQHHHSVDEMMMMLSNCLFGGHSTGHISAADDTSTSLVLPGGEVVALPVDGDLWSPKLPAEEIPLEEKKRKNTKDIALMERKSTKKICRRSRNGEHEVDGAVKAEAPPSFVHVRAKRGQATDSHSLAERVRRERISVRMKMLQNLVPGCDKMIGKAHILDAIINYVKSLQNQVEFLSMKIASTSSVLEACGVRFDDSMNIQTAAHECMMSLEEEEMWKIGETSVKIPTIVFQSTCSNNYEMTLDQASPSQFGPTSFSQDGSSCCVVQVSEQYQRNCQSNGPLLQQ